VGVPGFSLIFSSFKAVHNVASCSVHCAEESARLTSYCDAMATALLRLKGKITETQELTTALREAAMALNQLRDMKKEHLGQSTIAKMVTSVSYKSASEKAMRMVWTTQCGR